MKKLPKLWRKKRGGRFVGAFHATVKGSDVNFRTTDAQLAGERLREALAKGRRNFDDDEANVAHLEEAPPAPFFGTSATPGSDAGAPPAPVAAPPAPPVFSGNSTSTPRELPPMPASDASDAADMAAAADAVGGRDSAGAGGAGGAGPAPEADPAVLDALLEQGAAVIVDAQLQIQAYLIKRRWGLIAGDVPHDSELRTGAAKAWAAQLKVWFPSATALPPWAMALILPVLLMPVQLQGARKPEDVQADAARAAAVGV